MLRQAAGTSVAGRGSAPQLAAPRLAACQQVADARISACTAVDARSSERVSKRQRGADTAEPAMPGGGEQASSTDKKLSELERHPAA